MEAGGFTGPYPTEAPTPQIKDDGEAAAGSTTALPNVAATPLAKTDDETSAGGTEAAPVLATSVASSVAIAARSTSDMIFSPPAGLAAGEASAGYSGSYPTVASTPDLPLATRELERPVAESGAEASAGYSTALPAVASTPSPSLGTVIAGYPPTANVVPGLSTGSY